MFFLYRWWERYRVTLIFLLLGAGSSWFLLQTNGAALLELYRFLTLPFHPNPVQQDQLLQAHTWELQQRLKELELQNQKLQQLLGQSEIVAKKSIAAPIIGRSADHWWQQILLGRGSADGLQVGSIVLAPGGLVGRVTSLSAHTSRVLLLTDPTSRVGVVVGRTREMGILRGQSNDRAVLNFFDKDPKVRVGDTVLTSSLSSLFPASLPIGRIASVDFKDRANPRAMVELTAPIANLEWVTVTLDAKSPEAMVAPQP